ncbi:SGS-domain-containing protein [Thelephora terrestris]|uniref:SGS-domain-containing protein n=1 Tax=Thelephora terrestris TaxID=56493 RepID=A0A9P6HKF4_9AGAM|nr:SGS-domain-containing protein [Thelephora terrestris]
MPTPRYEFYETDDRLTLSIFDKGVDPADVQIKFEPRAFSYTRGDNEVQLEPLKGQIDTEKSDYTVGKIKVEVRLAKVAAIRWGGLVGDAPDLLNTFPAVATSTAAASAGQKPFYKNWDGITNTILSDDKPLSTSDDPNAGGDAAVNKFFQEIYGNADENTKRAMMKSFVESGGTTLSTNWDEVGKSPVDVKPPQGSEWKKWAE